MEAGHRLVASALAPPHVEEESKQELDHVLILSHLEVGQHVVDQTPKQ